MAERVKDPKKPLLWILSSSALAIALVIFLWFCSFQFDGRSPDDFPNYYFGGVRLWSGQPIYHNFIRPESHLIGFDYKAYPADPPFAVFIFSIYSALPYLWAWWLNIFISIFLLILAVWLACRYCEYTIPTFFLFISLALISNPFLFLIKRNHYEVLLGLLGLLGWNAFKREKTWMGALCWGLAASLKLFPALWFLALPRYIGWRAFWGSFLFLFFFSAIGSVAVGTSNTLDFFSHTIPKSEVWYGTAGNYSLLSISYAMNIPWLGWLLTFFALFLGIFLSFHRENNFTSQWIGFTTLSLILSPLSWLNYLTIIIPILIILTNFNKTNRQRLVLVVLFISLLFSPDYLKTSHLWSTVFLSSIPLFGLIGLWIYTFFNRSALLISRGIRTRL